MFQRKKSDLVWSWIMVGLNIFGILWGLIPGLMTMYSKDAGGIYVNACLLMVPAGNIMANVAPLLLVAFGYCLLVGFIYMRNQTIGSIRGLFIMSIVCVALSMLSLLPHNTVETWPYSVIPITFGVQTVVSFIRMQIDQRRADAFEEEYGC